jgi:Skp family chaperone for outer membrane proteins
LAELRESLQTTHRQLSEAHAAEIDAIKAQHATVLADTQAELTVKVRELQDQVAAMRDAAEQGSKSLEEAVRGQSQAEEEMAKKQQELESLRAALDRAQEEVAGQEAGGEEASKLKRLMEDMKDELEGTRQVSREKLAWHRQLTRRCWR